MTTTSDELAKLRYAAGVDHQAGALAWSVNEGIRRFWLVTSRRTGRWVLPKGSIDDGMTAPEAAAQEAFEEAGLICDVSPNAVGLYRIAKIRPPLIWSVEVSLFQMRVKEVLQEWQESKQRERRLVTIDEAAEMIEEREIIELLRRTLPGLLP